MLTSRRLTMLAVLAAMLPALLDPVPAEAHAILLDASPAAGSSVEAGVRPIELRFNSRIDSGRSTLRLIRPDRSSAPLPIAPDTPPDTLRSSTELAPGAHVLRWQVLAVDGHITRGDVRFTVVPRR